MMTLFVDIACDSNVRWRLCYAEKGVLVNPVPARMCPQTVAPVNYVKASSPCHMANGRKMLLRCTELV